MKLQSLLMGGLALWSVNAGGQTIQNDGPYIDASGGPSHRKQVARAEEYLEKKGAVSDPVYDVPLTELKKVSVVLKENGKCQIVISFQAERADEARAYIQRFARDPVRLGLGDYALPVDVGTTLKSGGDVFLMEQPRGKVRFILDSLLKEQK